MTKETPHTLILYNVTPKKTYIQDKRDLTPHTLTLYHVTLKGT